MRPCRCNMRQRSSVARARTISRYASRRRPSGKEGDVETACPIALVPGSTMALREAGDEPPRYKIEDNEPTDFPRSDGPLNGVGGFDPRSAPAFASIDADRPREAQGGGPCGVCRRRIPAAWHG